MVGVVGGVGTGDGIVREAGSCAKNGVPFVNRKFAEVSRALDSVRAAAGAATLAGIATLIRDVLLPAISRRRRSRGHASEQPGGALESTDDVRRLGREPRSRIGDS